MLQLLESRRSALTGPSPFAAANSQADDVLSLGAQVHASSPDRDRASPTTLPDASIARPGLDVGPQLSFSGGSRTSCQLDNCPPKPYRPAPRQGRLVPQGALLPLSFLGLTRTDLPVSGRSTPCGAPTSSTTVARPRRKPSPLRARPSTPSCSTFPRRPPPASRR